MRLQKKSKNLKLTKLFKSKPDNMWESKDKLLYLKLYKVSQENVSIKYETVEGDVTFFNIMHVFIYPKTK